VTDADLEPLPPERPPAVTAIGWIWLAASALRVLQSVLGYALWRAGGMEKGLPDFLVARLPHTPYDVNAFVRGLGLAIIVQGLIAVAVGFAAWNLLRLRSWARTAIEAVSWVAIFLWLGIGAVLIASLNPRIGAALSLGPPPGSREGTLLAASLGLLVAGLLGVEIHFLRRPDIRAAFIKTRR
jgi:hypothetical protein